MESPLMPSPFTYDGGSLTSSGAITDHANTDGPSPHPETAPFTLAMAVQSATPGPASVSVPDLPGTTAPAEGFLDQEMESPDTSSFSLPCAALPIAPPPIAVGADIAHCFVPDSASDPHPVPSAAVVIAADSNYASDPQTVPPIPAASPSVTMHKGRPRTKGSKAGSK